MSLVVEPTSVAQWQSLILEAERACEVNLGVDTESYLVFLLMRFVGRPEMAASVLGLEFLESAHDLSHAREDKLRDVGDKCLLYSGLFPGRAERRRVNISYFVKLGQAAYCTLSDHSPRLAAFYEVLCEKFVAMMEVLQTTRELKEDKSALSPLEAYSLWEDLRSQHALVDLKRYTDGMIFPFEKKHKH
ncbi:MAG: hypothetical protein HY939_06965 [Gammaproteobacteria bacterium]|nr:hypothetical protein [Gammaproteobacteria bacterium]